MSETLLIVRLVGSPGPQLPAILEAAGGSDRLVHQVCLGGRHLLILRTENEDRDRVRRIEQQPGVARVSALPGPFLLSAREIFSRRTQVAIVPGLALGGRAFLVMAGPCAVEGEAQIRSIAATVAACGAQVLRGGAYKPRTTPFCFQGLGSPGLDLLCRAGREHGLPTISEVLDQRHLDEVASKADLLQVGMRNALNYTLLADIGRHPLRRPVLLKCGIGTTLREFLCAADYILAGGNEKVILCLRGSAGFGNTSRAVLNMAELPALRRMTHLPIMVDPSHAAGSRDLVPALAAAALAAGADGLLVEVHDHPEKALSDGPQSLTPEQFGRMMHRLSLLAPALGRTLAGPARPAMHGDEHPLRDLGMEGPDTEGREPHLDE